MSTAQKQLLVYIHLAHRKPQVSIGDLPLRKGGCAFTVGIRRYTWTVAAKQPEYQILLTP